MQLQHAMRLVLTLLLLVAAPAGQAQRNGASRQGDGNNTSPSQNASAPTDSATRVQIDTLQNSVARAASGVDSLTLKMASLPGKNEIDALQRSVANISDQVDKLTSKTASGWTAALFGLFGVIAGGAINFLATRRIAKEKTAEDRKVAEEKAKFDVAKSIVEWKLRQLAELYGPLRTLFAQSNAVYRTMNTVLQSLDSEKFKLLEPSDFEKADFASFKKDADLDGKLFIVRLAREASWVRFRTVLYIDEVYGKHYEIELYFDKIVAISTSIVEVISTKAGLALSDADEAKASGQVATVQGTSGAGVRTPKSAETLRHKFGQYLAHAAVLQLVHANRRWKFSKKLEAEIDPGKVSERVPEKEPFAPALATHESAAFPQHIQRLVSDAHLALQLDIASWANRAK